MIRRTASEVLRSLESRIARLEGKTAYGRPDNYDARYTGEMEWNDNYDDDREEEKEALARAEKASQVVLRTLKQNKVPFSSVRSDRGVSFEFPSRGVAVQALMALDVKPSDVSRVIKGDKDFPFAGSFFGITFSQRFSLDGTYILHGVL